tara:strand:- start:1730 stop:2509 length:780 start_codon:yes stop_codon:yes gene_type:complete
VTCRNCHKELKDSQKYCDECGAKVIKNRLTPKILTKQINEQFLSIDNKLLLTFVDLFKRPETVIVEYIEGTRKKYIDVLQYFAIALTLAGIQVFLMTTFFKDSLNLDFLVNSASQEDNPFKDLNFEGMNQYQGIIYIIMVPFTAFCTWIVYFLLGQRQYNYTEHLVINLYYSAQIIIITAIFSILFLLFGLNYLIVSTILTIPLFLYLGYVLQRIFKEDFWATTAKFLLVVVVYIILYSIIGFIFGIILILFKYKTIAN